MAATRVKSGTSTGTASSATLTKWYDSVMVTNTGTTNPLYITTDGSTVATSAGDDMDVVMPGQTVAFVNRAARPNQAEGVAGAGQTVVSLIGSSTYTVTGV